MGGSFVVSDIGGKERWWARDTHGNELGKDESQNPHPADDSDPDELSPPATAWGEGHLISANDTVGKRGKQRVDLPGSEQRGSSELSDVEVLGTNIDAIDGNESDTLCRLPHLYVLATHATTPEMMMVTKANEYAAIAKGLVVMVKAGEVVYCPPKT